jgi:hypothetical protein
MNDRFRVYGWGDFTFLFKNHGPNPTDPVIHTTPNPTAVLRRRKLEELEESRQLRRVLREVWE